MIAQRLLAQLGSLSDVLAAEPDTLEAILPDDLASARFLQLVRATMLDALRSRVLVGPILSDGAALIEYLHADMAHSHIEHFRVLFLDTANRLLRDEVMSRGSVCEAPVYPREIMRRALQLGATALILVHNHPSGDPQPSPADIRLTRRIVEAGRTMDVRIHDHLVIARSGSFSFRREGPSVTPLHEAAAVEVARWELALRKRRNARLGAELSASPHGTCCSNCSWPKRRVGSSTRPNCAKGWACPIPPRRGGC